MIGNKLLKHPKTIEDASNIYTELGLKHYSFDEIKSEVLESYIIYNASILVDINNMNRIPNDTVIIRGTPYKEELYEVAPDIHQILKRLIEELPSKRDWLDPDLEKQAKDILNYIEKV